MRDWKEGGKDCLGPQVQTTSKDGQPGMVLNPQFVETLMGVPVNWTLATFAEPAEGRET
jgi:hypothetical protein